MKKKVWIFILNNVPSIGHFQYLFLLHYIPIYCSLTTTEANNWKNETRFSFSRILPALRIPVLKQVQSAECCKKGEFKKVCDKDKYYSVLKIMTESQI